MQKTEMRNPKTTHIDKADTLTALKWISEENKFSVEAVDKALPEIARAVDLVADCLNKGGRLIYVGAGTSGRIAMADAAECPPTFGASPDKISAVMAGGLSAVQTPAEGVEDDEAAGERDILAKSLTANDAVMGISAAGNAGYVVAAMRAAKAAGCKTISLSCNLPCKIAEVADVVIFTDTGAEVITGSTRMKAGNAQKMALNMISTCAMIKTGKVYENLMINLRPTNVKIRRRMAEVVKEILKTDGETAERILKENDYDINGIIEKYKP